MRILVPVDGSASAGRAAACAIALAEGRLNAEITLFQTGWFIESLATQVLVIFVLRTRRNPLKSRPHPLLIAISLAVVVPAVVLPFTSLGAWFGFVPPSATFLLAIAGLTVSYLVLAQCAKWAFYRR